MKICSKIVPLHHTDDVLTISEMEQLLRFVTLSMLRWYLVAATEKEECSFLQLRANQSSQRSVMGKNATSPFWGTPLEDAEVKVTTDWDSQLSPQLTLSLGNSNNFAFLKHLRNLATIGAGSCSGKHHAYVIPGSDPVHALAACTVAKQLRDLGLRDDIEIIGTFGADQRAVKVMRKCGQFDQVVKSHMEENRKPGGYYNDIAIKFEPFGGVFFQAYDRIIALDSDVQVLKNMDFLFCISPKYELVFPRAYWISQDTGTGAIYVIKPKEQLYDSMLRMWNTPSHDGGYPEGEMDVVNDFYNKAENRNRMAFLPANFLVLDSHWHLQEEHNPPNPNPFPGALDNIYCIHFTGYGKAWMHNEEDDLKHFNLLLVPTRKKWWVAYIAMRDKVNGSES